MTPTLRKALVWAGLILFGIIAGRSMRSPQKPDPLVPKLQAERDSLRLALTRWDAFAKRDSGTVAGLDSVAKKLRVAKRTRDSAATQIGNDRSFSGNDTDRLQQRADTLWKLYAACSVSEDSALALADRYRDAHRQAVQAAGLLYAETTKAEGMLNLATIRIQQLSGRSRFRLGLTAGAVGGFDAAGPFYGPGAALGATLKVRLPLVHLPVGVTVGGVAGLDLLGRVRLGPGVGVGVTF